MKKLIFILASLVFLSVSNLSYGAEPSPLDQAGKLSGRVTHINRASGILEIQTIESGITRLQLAEDAMDQIKNIKPGDKVFVMLTIKATSTEKKGEGGDHKMPPCREKRKRTPIFMTKQS